MPIKSNLQRMEERHKHNRRERSVKDGTRESRAKIGAKRMSTFHVLGWKNLPRTAP